MFYECSSLIKIPDISKWNTSNLKSMNELFYNCTSLINVPDLSKWKIDKINDIQLNKNSETSIQLEISGTSSTNRNINSISNDLISDYNTISSNKIVYNSLDNNIFDKDSNQLEDYYENFYK